MRILYLNCFSGISGDMFLGAMLDLGVGVDTLARGLASLDIAGLEIRSSIVDKKGIKAVKADVIAPDTVEERHLAEILPIIRNSGLPADITGLAEAVFRRLAVAEAKVHGTGIEHVHFHEVGALDTIADVVGAAICLQELGVDRVYASPINVGGGRVRISHGVLPVPAPATEELLQGVPFYGSDAQAELTTPTGAAILTEVCKGFGPMPAMRPVKTGFGAGCKDLETPNVLMAVLGEML